MDCMEMSDREREMCVCVCERERELERLQGTLIEGKDAVELLVLTSSD
jgi:hypothetical protein